MSKEVDLHDIKEAFTDFGSDVLAEFKKQYDKKGMSFKKTSLEKMCIKLSEEVGEVSSEVFKGDSPEELLEEIIDVANVAFMMYIVTREIIKAK